MYKTKNTHALSFSLNSIFPSFDASDPFPQVHGLASWGAVSSPGYGRQLDCKCKDKIAANLKATHDNDAISTNLGRSIFLFRYGHSALGPCPDMA